MGVTIIENDLFRAPVF